MQYLWDQSLSIESVLKKTHSLCLFLDFDGTLSPFVSVPSNSKLPKNARRILKKLSSINNLHLGIISGRALDDIKDKVKISNILYSGNHGIEWEYKEKRYQHRVPIETLRLLRKIKDEMLKISLDFNGCVVEDKIFSVAFHYRRINVNKKLILEEILEQRLSKYLQNGYVSLLLNKETYDVRANNGWNKGSIVKHLSKVLSKERHEVIYIGDSKTDEDVFDRLSNNITIKVGSTEKSLARYFLKDEKEVQSFLEWLFYKLNDIDVLQ